MRTAATRRSSRSRFRSSSPVAPITKSGTSPHVTLAPRRLACIEVFGKIDTEPIDGKTKNYEYAKIKAVYSNNYKLKTTFDAPALQNAGHDGCFRMGQTA